MGICKRNFGVLPILLLKDSEARIKDLNQELITNASAVSIPLSDIRPQLVENNGKITKELKQVLDNTKKFLQGSRKEYSWY